MPFKGYKQTKNHIKKRMKVHIGRKCSKKQKLEQSKIMKNWIKLNGNPMQGKYQFKKSKLKISKSKKGCIPWNKGKHYHQTEQAKINMKNSLLGRKHSLKARKNMSKAQIKVYIEGIRKNFKYCYFRKDLGHICRSKFEANYCRILKYKGIKYIYESEKKCVFKLSNGTNYICDLYLPKIKEYRELKGYPYNKEHKKKYRLFRKKYPNIKWRLILQTSKEWNSLKKEYQNKIKEWESV